MSRMTKGEKIFQYFNIAIMVLLSATFIIPFIILISSSFVNEADAAKYGSYVLFPHSFHWDAYSSILGRGSLLGNAYKITIFRVIIGSALNLVFTTMLAYGLSRKSVPGRGLFTTIVIITMFFGGGLIPTYLQMRSLGLINTFWIMVLPGLISPWNMTLMRNFFQQIPIDLEEAAMIDGATPGRILVSVIIPLSTPIIATITLFSAVGHWNSWFDGMIYMKTVDKYPLQTYLQTVVINPEAFFRNATNVSEELANYMNLVNARTTNAAQLFLATVPILCIYPFLQRYFTTGLVMGSVKG